MKLKQGELLEDGNGEKQTPVKIDRFDLTGRDHGCGEKISREKETERRFVC